MKVLFDQGTPAPLRRALAGHTVETAYERGWSKLQNGELIAAAQGAGFEGFVTTDRNLKYQQNLAAKNLSIVVLLTTSCRAFSSHCQQFLKQWTAALLVDMSKSTSLDGQPFARGGPHGIGRRKQPALPASACSGARTNFQEAKEANA